MGLWLERAGFKPDSRVQVRLVAPGILELRSDDLPLKETVSKSVSAAPEK
jgi:hypothetical protein